MKGNVLRIIIISLAIKVLYFVFALVATNFKSEINVEPTTRSFIGVFKKNDSGWYEKAAFEGYPKVTNTLDLGYSFGKYYKQSVWAQFPLYPITIRATNYILQTDFLESAFLISLIFSTCCFLVFYFICKIVFSLSEEHSFYNTLLFIVLPFHYYFSMYYTESLYFTFLGFSFILIKKNYHILLFFSIAALTLIRPNGIASVLPLFIYFIEERGGFKLFFNKLKNFDKGLVFKSLSFLAAPISLGLYCLYQKHMTNHYFAFVQAQYGWYKEFMFPLAGLFRRGDFTTQFNSVYVILFLLISILCWRKFTFSFNLLIWVSMLLPLMSGSVACMPRYISVIFPIILFISNYFYRFRFRYLFVAIFLILHLLTFYPWLISHPFSY